MSESLLQIQPISEMPLVRRDAPVPLGPEAPRAALISLGCAKNTVDSEIMLAALAGAGYRLVSEAEDAQVAIINTCGFIEDAKRESIDTILEVAQLKEAGGLETRSWRAVWPSATGENSPRGCSRWTCSSAHASTINSLRS